MKEELKSIFYEIEQEYEFATKNFAKINSEHEGIAVIREEYLELEKEVFKNQLRYDKAQQKKEAIQLATTAIRFIKDCVLKERE